MERLWCGERAAHGPSPDRFFVPLAVLLLGAVASALLSFAQAGAALPTEYEVKAALLYKFAKFVEWPEGAFADRETPVGVCVLGAHALRRALDLISEQTIQGRRIMIWPLNNESKLPNDCHLAFIGEDKAYQLAAALRKFADQPVLTVGDAPGFTKSGGVLGLRTVENKIRFEINLDAADKAGLVISSQVLNLATVLPRRNQREAEQ